MTTATTSHLRNPALHLLARYAPVAFLLLIPVVTVDVTVWPGHLNDDSLNMFSQIATGDYTNWWAPLSEWLWHLPYKLGLGPGYMLTLQTAGLCVGCYLILRTVLGRIPAALATAVIALVPPVFAQLILVGRDMWFLSATLLTFGCTSRALQSRGRVRLIWLLLALAACWLAQAARQNALSVLCFDFGYVIWYLLGEASSSSFWHRWRGGWRRWAIAVGGAVVLSLGIYAEQAVQGRVIGVKDTYPTQALSIYDLEVMSHQVGKNLFPRGLLNAPGMSDIRKYYNNDNMVPILILGIGHPGGWLPKAGAEKIRKAWLSAIRDYPLDYLDDRFTLALRQLSITREPLIVYQPNNFSPNSFHFRVEHPGLDRAALDYLDLFTHGGYLDGGVLFDAWIYLLLATVGGLVLLRAARCAPLVGVFAAIGAATWGLQLGLLPFATGTTYRYEDFTLMAGLINLVGCAVVLYRRWRVRTKGEDRQVPRMQSAS